MISIRDFDKQRQEIRQFFNFVLKTLINIYKSLMGTEPKVLYKHIKFNPPPSSRVSPIAVPPLRKLEGTPGACSAGGHTRLSPVWHFSHYATACTAHATQQHCLCTCTAVSARRSLRSSPCDSSPEQAHAVNSIPYTKLLTFL